jgi:hypothetical protein
LKKNIFVEANKTKDDLISFRRNSEENKILRRNCKKEDPKVILRDRL